MPAATGAFGTTTRGTFGGSAFGAAMPVFGFSMPAVSTASGTFGAPQAPVAPVQKVIQQMQPQTVSSSWRADDHTNPNGNFEEELSAHMSGGDTLRTRAGDNLSTTQSRPDSARDRGHVGRNSCRSINKSFNTTENLTATQGTNLIRLYTVDCGNEMPTQLSNFDLFKIDRACKNVQGSLQIITATNSSDSLQTHDLIRQDASSDWCGLITMLQQIQTLGEDDYKKVLKRLFLKWHPDKCKKSHAAQYFQVLRRHEASYKGDKDFTWLLRDEDSMHPDAARERKNTADTEARWEYDRGEQTNSWFAEFEREKMRETEAVYRQHAAQAHNAGIRARTQPAAEPREFDRNLADGYWESATHSGEGMTINFDNGRWANSVWDGQQACEFAIKGVMLRTCGISEEEKKGKGAHDLVLHMSDRPFEKYLSTSRFNA